MFLLADVNSMYCACEQAFRPDLKGRPVAVLSNNDGALVAINREGKKLGLKRGMPYFQAKEIIKNQNVTVFSSNYSLYGDMSARCMTILESLAPAITIYSIDEAFLHVAGIDATESFEDYGRRVRDTVLQQTGLTCGIGIAQTMTLAKLANQAAKTWPATGGVVDLTNRDRQRRLMALLPASEIWGCGLQLTKKLAAMGINTALQLADSNQALIRRTFGVVLERTVLELNGVPCISIEALPAKQQIIVSRSFGQRVTQLQDIRQAVCQYAERAAEKLRRERQFCRHISVFVRTSPFAPHEPYYANSNSAQLMLPTQDTRDIVAAAVKALDAIWRDGFRYQKAGIMLNDFCDKPGQIDLFDEHPPRAGSEQLMKVVDGINHSGLGKIWFAGQGTDQVWRMRRDLLSPAYTTRWKDIPVARVI
ncbi:translesion error-prone DNA polymerase V subunit UmuC [Serratia bockelmannii]|uniref:Translesion error-prone DNA polymerase V subunit UmuC n=1 Tax=Serratia bockelmannii TaxID=2703793 RepID=A0ABT8LZM4_9GAMM|nr:translesion error-prone DNA polymerase V subunit UmuC [Serratia bockelmannii]MDN6881563.1 translesion error-prone DNA polymerase V subunit UmuC [Serratia bockelmannii]HBH6890249.1 translesion error-prone DNA polymerase V subunit UmuC [Serratia marcescens]